VIADHDETITAALRDRGQRVTVQRLVMHRVVRELDRHVTAEEVLHAVQRRLPGVSLPTVYATLELFEELGLVRRLATRPGAALYEARLDGHHHASCRSCGLVLDLPVEVELAPGLDAARAAGFADPRAELVVSGLCAACATG
jgi:Fe2+ or Zn2+ uptake regulation protein